MGIKRTGERRNHRLPESLSDEQIAGIAKEGNIPKKNVPLLARHLRGILNSPMDNEYSITSQVKRIEKLCLRALRSHFAGRIKEGSVLLQEIALALQDPLPEVRDDLTRLVSVHLRDLPHTAEFVDGAPSIDTWERVELLYGLTSPEQWRRARGRGAPIDHTAAGSNFRLALIYGIVSNAPSPITLGRGDVHSPFERFMAAALTQLNWRSPEAEGRPKQARSAFEAIEDAGERRLNTQLEAEEDSFPLIEPKRNLTIDSN